MVGTLSPAAVNYDENSTTLFFAATVKNIKVSKILESYRKVGVPLGEKRWPKILGF